LVASNNLLLHKDHKSLVPQNCEQKLTLPSIDEHLVSDDGVLMFNVHKLNIKNKEIESKRKSQVELQIDLNVITFFIDISC
jgi:hypothetical protein